MTDTSHANPNLDDEPQTESDPDRPSNRVVEEAAIQFARLFLRQCLYNRRQQKNKAKSETTKPIPVKDIRVSVLPCWASNRNESADAKRRNVGKIPKRT